MLKCEIGLLCSLKELKYFHFKLKFQNFFFQIVDVGSGRGYLSTQLSYIYDLNVIAIDSSKNYVSSSMKRLDKMKKQTNLQIDSIKINNKYHTFNEYISTNVNLNKLIKDRLGIEMSEYGLIGLHSCGNLSNSPIDLYLNNLNQNAGISETGDGICCLLCNVSCCYHLIDEKYAPIEYSFINKNGDDNYNDSNSGSTKIEHKMKFPLCSSLNRKAYFLGRNARTLSSQPIDRLITNDQV